MTRAALSAVMRFESDLTSLINILARKMMPLSMEESSGGITFDGAQGEKTGSKTEKEASEGNLILISDNLAKHLE